MKCIHIYTYSKFIQCFIPTYVTSSSCLHLPQFVSVKITRFVFASLFIFLKALLPKCRNKSILFRFWQQKIVVWFFQVKSPAKPSYDLSPARKTKIIEWHGKCCKKWPIDTMESWDITWCDIKIYMESESVKWKNTHIFCLLILWDM